MLFCCSRATKRPVQFVSRPWRSPDGTINRPVLRMMLEGVLMHLLQYPGASFASIKDKFNVLLQPVPLTELIEVQNQNNFMYIFMEIHVQPTFKFNKEKSIFIIIIIIIIVFIIIIVIIIIIIILIIVLLFVIIIIYYYYYNYCYWCCCCYTKVRKEFINRFNVFKLCVKDIILLRSIHNMLPYTCVMSLFNSIQFQFNSIY